MIPRRVYEGVALIMLSLLTGSMASMADLTGVAIVAIVCLLFGGVWLFLGEQ